MIKNKEDYEAAKKRLEKIYEGYGKDSLFFHPDECGEIFQLQYEIGNYEYQSNLTLWDKFWIFVKKIVK